jgi:hypothetical protein
VSPPPTHPELEALGPVESARRLTPDRESMGGMETPVKTGEASPTDNAVSSRRSITSSWSSTAALHTHTHLPAKLWLGSLLKVTQATQALLVAGDVLLASMRQPQVTRPAIVLSYTSSTAMHHIHQV